MVPFNFAFDRSGNKTVYSDYLSDYMQEAIRSYVVYGLYPGGFLSSVLANDLVLAASRADSTNKDRLAYIAMWVSYNVPGNAKGSYEAVDNWCRDNPEQKALQSRIEKEYAWDVLRARA